jgi:hypothetical protein
MAKKKAARESRPSDAGPRLGPVLDPDHDAILANATWSLERTQRFNAADDPILYAREWVSGYEFRLGEADRARHYPNATQEDFQRMLKWADDPKRDRCYEAIALLLERIKKHPQPVYSPEVLKLEHDRLWDIPVHARLREGFADRFRAWVDRVETFLSMGGGGNAGTKPTTPPVGADESAGPALTMNQSRVLQTMARFDASRLVSADAIAVEMEAAERLSARTIGPIVRKLIEMRLAERPEGDRSGARLTTAGRRLALKVAD